MNKKYNNMFLTFTIVISFIALYISFQTLYSLISIDGNGEFYKSIFSSMIGGLFTIFGVGLTVLYYIKRDQNSNRLKIRPFLRLNPGKSDLEKQIYVDFDSNDYAKSELGTMSFQIENIGLGPAIDIEFSELTDHTSNKQGVILSLKANEKTYYEIFYALKDVNKKLELAIIFKDLYENRYKQEFTIMNDNFRAEVIQTNEPKLLNN